MFRSIRLRTLAVVAAAIVALASPAGAQPKATVIASGLDNPRGLAFAPNGLLYVAEAGRGAPPESGPKTCFRGEGGEACFGLTGAVTRVGKGHPSQVLTGLPSHAAEDGSFALGPTDVSFQGVGGMYITLGLGANPAIREDVPELTSMGRLVRGRPSQNSWTNVADIAAFEAAANPDGQQLDSNPNSVLATGGGQAVVDAGGNALLWVSTNRKISTLAVFPTRQVDAPPFLDLPPGSQIPMDSVPTSVVKGPDGAVYVGELTGFPFPQGEALVYRVVPGHAPKIFAEGFTNIIDIAFDRRGRLYVLEIAHKGLHSDDPITGALIRVNADGSREILMDKGLTNPGGLALRGDAAYVSNCGTCVETGTVLRIPLN